METPQKRRGLFSRTTARLLLLLALLLAPQAAQAAAPSFNGIDSADAARAYFHVSGDNLPTTQYQTIPQTIGGADSVRPKQLKVVICATTGSGGSGQCSQSSRDAHVFGFARMHHEELGGGADYWDYSFVATGNAKLQFLYRKNPKQASHWGLVYGETDPNVDFTENKVAGLADFDETDLARNILEPKADDDGLAWAKRGGIQTSTNQTGFLDRSEDDPFMKAIEKATEAVNSLNEAVSNALLWAIETSNPNEVKGLGEAWQTIRDLVNVLFMVILVALAIVTIVRIDVQRYNVRSLLPMLIFAVITVNFSFLFGTVIVNTAYILSQPFLVSAREIIEHAGALGGGFGANVDSFGTAFVMLLAALLLLVALIILLFFFVIRIIMIWLLSATSPIIFLAMVLPLTRGEASKMVGQWVKWVYMAPISFVVLYIGSRVVFPNPGQDESTDALLAALFYGGLIVAAALLPLALGGQVMRLAARRGTGAAKLGGKGGLGLAGAIPLGRGMSVGEAVRTGKQALELRQGGQTERARERAAEGLVNLNERLGGGGLATSVVGFDAGQAQPIQNDLVDKHLKKAMLGGMNEANFSRMVAHRMGQKPNLSAAERGYVQNLKQTWGEASLEERQMAESGIGEKMAVKGLGQSGFLEWGMMPQYAKYGYQEAMGKYDPLMGAIRKNYRGGAIGAENIDMTRVGVAVSSPGGDDQRLYVPEFWSSVEDTSEFARRATPGALDGFRQTIRDRTSTAAMGAIMDPTNRVSASDPRRATIARIRDTYLRPDVKKVVEAADRKKLAREAGHPQVT